VAAIIKLREKNYFDATPKKARSMTIRTEKGKGREALHRAVPLGRFYDVGGRQLMLYASGT
jgi:hypothetical protein